MSKKKMKLKLKNEISLRSNIKCRFLKQIPASNKNYKILLKSAIKAVENSPKRMQIPERLCGNFQICQFYKTKQEQGVCFTVTISSI